MRIIFDIPEEEINRLDEVASKRNVSRAELIRQAIRGFLGPIFKSKKKLAFGIWADREIDALDYENELRSEWDQ